MRRIMNNRVAAATLLSGLVVSCILFSGCAKPNFMSAWKNHEIPINGKYTDFGNAMVYYDERSRVAINMFNDNEFLYICLISRNRNMEKQLMESGFVVWFDPENGKKKMIGIRFPIGMREMGMPLAEDEAEPNFKEGMDHPPEDDSANVKKDAGDFEKHLEVIEGLQEEIEIMIGAVNGNVKLSLNDAKKQGIEVKVGRQNGYFVYEIKMPLMKSAHRQYAIGAKPGKHIGMVLEMAGPGKSRMGRNGGIEGGGRRTGPPDAGYDTAFGGSFKVWSTVTLSPGPSN